MSALTAELRAQLDRHSSGVANLKWQLRQKESALKALESRLEETFPLAERESEDNDYSDPDDCPLKKRRRKNTASIEISERGIM